MAPSAHFVRGSLYRVNMTLEEILIQVNLPSVRYINCEVGDRLVLGKLESEAWVFAGHLKERLAPKRRLIVQGNHVTYVFTGVGVALVAGPVRLAGSGSRVAGVGHFERDLGQVIDGAKIATARGLEGVEIVHHKRGISSGSRGNELGEGYDSDGLYGKHVEFRGEISEWNRM